MILQNEICHIEINIDETYTVDSVDNRHYDVTLNPEHYRHNDLSKTLSIHIGLYAREFQVALIGPYHSYDLDCAVLQDDILTVLQDNMITQIKITDAYIIRRCHKQHAVLHRIFLITPIRRLESSSAPFINAPASCAVFPFGRPPPVTTNIFFTDSPPPIQLPKSQKCLFLKFLSDKPVCNPIHNHIIAAAGIAPDGL